MKSRQLLIACLGLVASVAAVADGHVSKAPEGAKVYFIEPASGATVAQTFAVKFGLSGMGVAPAGVDKDNTGHHHILINTSVDQLDLGAPLPASDTVVHFGGGQTEAELSLPPGEHTLQLLLGNYAHVPHSEPVISEQITVVVE